MKLYLHELKEKTSFQFTHDFSNDILAIPDILSIEPAKIQMDVAFRLEELHVDLSVDVMMNLACSKTLKPVLYHMQFQDLIIFGDTDDADYPLSDPIPFSDIIFGYIVSEKPYTIYHPDAKDVTFEKEKSPHPAFAELDKTFNK